MSTLLLSFATMTLGFGPTRYRFEAGFGYAIMLWFGLLDVVLVIGILAGAPATFRRLRAKQTDPFVTAGALLVIALATSCAIHPVDRGVGIVLRLLGATIATDWFVAEAQSFGRTVTRWLTVVGLAEWVLVVAQRARGGRSFGLLILGERPIQRFPFGDAYATMGTMPHPYLAAGFVGSCASLAVVGALRGHVTKKLAAVLCFAAGSVSILNLSRFTVLGVGLMAFVLLIVAKERRMRKSALAFIACFALGAGLSLPFNADGWTYKAKMNFSKEEGLSSGRSMLFRENLTVFRENPFFGVGTGRYALARLDAGYSRNVRTPAPPHNLVLAALSEAGALALPALAMLGYAIFALIRKRNWVALIPIAWLASPTMLEQFMWNSPEGMLMVAMCLGATALLPATADQPVGIFGGIKIHRHPSRVATK